MNISVNIISKQVSIQSGLKNSTKINSNNVVTTSIIHDHTSSNINHNSLNTILRSQNQLSTWATFLSFSIIFSCPSPEQASNWKSVQKNPFVFTNYSYVLISNIFLEKNSTIGIDEVEIMLPITKSKN